MLFIWFGQFTWFQRKNSPVLMVLAAFVAGNSNEISGT
jgi:hypothetical protein